MNYVSFKSENSSSSVALLVGCFPQTQPVLTLIEDVPAREEVDSLSSLLKEELLNEKSTIRFAKGATYKTITANSEQNYVFNKIEQIDCLGSRYNIIIAKNKTQPKDILAIRTRSGQSGYSQWMNELQVYLLPNFKHNNILNHFGLDTLDDCQYEDQPTSRLIKFIKKSGGWNELEKNENDERKNSTIRIEYWLINRYHQCRTLRDYLRSHTITWPQMISIATGIINGLHFLHENTDYQRFDSEILTKGFIQSTKGVLKKISFINENRSTIFMRPHLFLSIIHRNLNSLNIVLKGDNLTPCIWNFGASYIYHPFQPSNQQHYIDPEMKDIYLASQYSPPEVLQQKGHLTLNSMKSIDMYACGILFWELISRCILPKLDFPINEEENKERSEPDRYYEPFEKEFDGIGNTVMLEYAVCKLYARPKIKTGWLLGRKTNKFVQIFQDLWDHDHDARLHTTTVLNRLTKLNLTDHDKRYKYSFRNSIVFDISTMWPPEFNYYQAPPYTDKYIANILIKNLTEASDSVKRMKSKSKSKSPVKTAPRDDLDDPIPFSSAHERGYPILTCEQYPFYTLEGISLLRA